MPLLLWAIAAIIVWKFISSATKGEIDLTNYLKNTEDEKGN